MMMFRLLDKITGGDKRREEYFNRHIVPHLNRGMANGLTPQEVGELATQAIAEADYQIMYPDMLLRDLVNARIAKVLRDSTNGEEKE